MDEYLDIAEKILSEKSLGIYLVGGAVRDALLKIPLVDLDFVITNQNINKTSLLNAVQIRLSQHCVKDSIEIQDRIDTYRTFKINFTLATEPAIERIYDFVFSRAEVYPEPASKPVVREGTLLEDALRRDFTINAMASSSVRVSHQSLIDSVHGLSDLNHKLIRVLHDKSFIDDPMRIIRALRFMYRFTFSIEQKTQDLMMTAIKDKIIEKCSLGRRYFELYKVFSEPSTWAILKDLHSKGALNSILGTTGPISIRELNTEIQDPNEKLKMFISLLPNDDRTFVVKQIPVRRDVRRQLLS